MGNRERRSSFHQRCLRCNAAGPEDRLLVGFDLDRITKIRLGDVANADGRRIAEQRLQDSDIRYVPVVGGTMDEAFRQLYCEDPEKAGATPIPGDYRPYRDRQFDGAG